MAGYTLSSPVLKRTASAKRTIGNTVAKPNLHFRWTPHRDPYERAVAAFKVSYMSNAKWRKVLAAVCTAELDIQRSVWKYIDGEHPVVYHAGMPPLHHILDTGVGDIAPIGPVEYKWIESIHFPRMWHPVPGVGYTVTQDVAELKRLLMDTAQLHIEENEDGITLCGYGR